MAKELKDPLKNEKEAALFLLISDLMVAVAFPLEFWYLDVHIVGIPTMFLIDIWLKTMVVFFVCHALSVAIGMFMGSKVDPDTGIRYY